MDSHEGEFWNLASQAQAKKIARSRCAQLAKLCSDFERAVDILRSALNTKNPSTYLGAVVARLRDEQSPRIIVPSRTQEPEIVLQGRLRGWPVRKTVLDTGEPGWWCAGVLYDRTGDAVGG